MKKFTSALLAPAILAQTSTIADCQLTGKPAEKPVPSLSFCFRSNIDACCITAHDSIINGAYTGYMPEMCVNSYVELEFFACFGCHY